jgi:hypothetical protein
LAGNQAGRYEFLSNPWSCHAVLTVGSGTNQAAALASPIDLLRPTAPYSIALSNAGEAEPILEARAEKKLDGGHSGLRPVAVLTTSGGAIPTSVPGSGAL